MEISDLPIFRIQKLVDDASARGTLSRWEWVGDHHIVYLFLGHGKFARGRWADLDETAQEVTFVPDDSADCPAFSPGVELPFADGYWGERALLALNPDLKWEEVEFRPRDAICHLPDGRTEVIPDGWDHEHCSICSAKISTQENTTYMRLDANDCLCLECYREYVCKRSIGFIYEG